KLMCSFVGKFDDLIFYGRAITWADGLNLAGVHGRAVHVLANDAMGLRRGPGDVAGHLRIVMRNPLGAKTERSGIRIAGLNLKLRPINGAAIETRRGPGLQAASA